MNTGVISPYSYNKVSYSDARRFDNLYSFLLIIFSILFTLRDIIVSDYPFSASHIGIGCCKLQLMILLSYGDDITAEFRLLFNNYVVQQGIFVPDLLFWGVLMLHPKDKMEVIM